MFTPGSWQPGAPANAPQPWASSLARRSLEPSCRSTVGGAAVAELARVRGIAHSPNSGEFGYGSDCAILMHRTGYDVGIPALLKRGAVIAGTGESCGNCEPARPPLLL